jgi:uncharacterized protein
MSVDTALAVAKGVRTWAESHPVYVLWHGGEPLAAGLSHVDRLLGLFPKAIRHPVRHGIQTNATLIDDAWCELFARRSVHVSVSLDGPPEDNAARTDHVGRDSTERTLRGIRALRAHGIPFTAIAVVRHPSATAAHTLYDWFASLTCTSLGVNLVERKGVQMRSGSALRADVVEFWAALASRTESDGRLRIRDIDHALRFLRRQLAGGSAPHTDPPSQPTPLVMWNGDVIPIGPELAGFSSPAHGRFTVGNVRDRAWPRPSHAPAKLLGSRKPYAG